MGGGRQHIWPMNYCSARGGWPQLGVKFECAVCNFNHLIEWLVFEVNRGGSWTPNVIITRLEFIGLTSI